jgi:archaellum component FlaC
MQHLAEYFASTTTQLYLDQIEKISRTTESMAEIQSRTAETLGSVTTIYTESKDCIRQVGDISTKVLDRYDDYLSNVHAMNEKLSESVVQLEGLVEYIRNNSRNQNFTIDNLSKFQEDLLSVSNQSMNSMQTFFNDFNDQYSSSIISLHAASSDMLKAGELLKESYAGLAEGVNLEVEQVFHTFEEDLATISVHLSQSIHDLQEAIDELPEILRRISKG